MGRLRIADVVAALAVLLLAALVPARGLAAAPPPGPMVAADAPLPTLAAAIDAATAHVNDMNANVHARTMSDDEIHRRLDLVPGVRAVLEVATPILVQRLADQDARLAQIGPPPAAGQPPESAETASERQSLARQRAAIDTELRQAKLLAVETAQTERILSDRLRDNFRQRLWTRSRSILAPSLWMDVAGTVRTPSPAVRAEVHAEGRRLAGPLGSRAGLWLTVAAMALMIWPGRRLAERLGWRWFDANGAPSALDRALLALWVVLSGCLLPTAGAGLVYWNLQAAGALTPVFAEVGIVVWKAVLFGFLVESLGRALLASSRPEARLAPIPDSMARRLAPFPGVIALTSGVAFAVTGASGVLGIRLDTAIALDCLSVLAQAMSIGGALAAVAEARHRHYETHAPATTVGRGAAGVWLLAVGAAWLALAITFGAVLTGYLALAIFLMRETVWIGIVLSSLYVLLAVADDLFPAVLSPQRGPGRMLSAGLGLSAPALEHTAVLISGLVRLALLLMAWSMILVPFGASVTDVMTRITSPSVAFHIGAVPISPGAILGAVALFVVGLLITRAVKGWMDSRWLPKTGLDIGVRTSLSAAVGYSGAGLALLLAFAYLGLSFSQIALFASALSVGIGFGLQNVIGNFVSGLILLAERPVKVGDWVAIGDLQGDVKRISIRATEIQMFDRSHLIVPNSDLISKTVKNFTHTGALGRVMIVLKVQNDADPVKVKATLLAQAAAHADVLKDPAPGVFLTDVRDGALEFTIYAYVRQPRQAFGVKSQLLFDFVAALRSEGVTLYSSNTVVNLGLGDAAGPPPRPEAGPEAPDEA